MINIKKIWYFYKSYKIIDNYDIGYITVKDLDIINIHSISPLYFIIDKADGYIEESSRNRDVRLIYTVKGRHIKQVYRAAR